MTYSHALVLGLIQGLTEFLPVSSSGHLVLAQQFVGLKENMVNFDIFLHFGTLLAVLLVFRVSILTMIFGSLRDIRSCVQGKTTWRECYRDSLELRLVAALIIGTIPAVLVGLMFKEEIEVLFSSTIPVLCALGITGVLLIATFFLKKGEAHITPLTGFIVGIAQALAIIPGISRSGATITTALFFKVNRSEAGEFSFILSVPAVAGATLLAVLDVAGSGAAFTSTGPSIAGAATAFFSGWLSLVVLMRIIRSGKIGYFGYYCLAVVLLGIILFGTGVFPADSQSRAHRETGVTENVVELNASFDGARQMVRYLRVQGKSRPLLVALHTWSYDYTQDVCEEYFTRCRERGWHCIFPDFRGANDKPEACGSEAALSDILDAVKWAVDEFDVDPRRIFLAGASGGGHMSLLAAGHAPSTWTAVSAWVPISDLARWYDETKERGLGYTEHLEKSCGGPPGTSPRIDGEYRMRSPLTALWRAHIIPMDINAGIHDGHGGTFGGSGSVPVGQSIRAFNELVRAAGKSQDSLHDDIISFIEREERTPDGVPSESSFDSVYGREIPLRRTSGLTRLTVFEGGHEIIYDAAFEWFERF